MGKDVTMRSTSFPLDIDEVLSDDSILVVPPAGHVDARRSEMPLRRDRSGADLANMVESAPVDRAEASRQG